ncbi:MAG: hypothetical protein ABL957_12795 [Parvularculaceae bacterium]
MSDTNSHQRILRLSPNEWMFLENSAFLTEDLKQILAAAEPERGKRRILRLDRDTAERFRDEFTARLARIGLDAKYELTREGSLLERLIDRFAK